MFMEKVIEGLAQYGPLGLILIALGFYIIHLHKMHNEERKEWKEIAKESNQNIKDNTSILSSLKTMLEYQLK